MMRLRAGPTRLLWISVALFLLSCGKEDPPAAPQEQPLDLNEEIEKGWTLFQSHDYSASRSTFARLIDDFPDAPVPYTGVGWCDVEADSLSRSIVFFRHALRIAEDPDALAGLAVASSAMGLDSLAVDAASRIDDPAYRFTGDPGFGYRQIVYIRALGEFHLLLWEDCLASLLILDPSLQIELGAWDFREQLFAALEALGDAR